MDKDGFIKIIDFNNKDEITHEVLNNDGSFSTPTEEKMLINMTGISINAKPRADGRFHGYAMRDGEKKYFYGKTTAEVQKKIQDYLNSAPTPKRKKRNTDTTPLFEIYAAQWVEQYKKPNLKPKSLETLHFALKKAVEAFSGKTIGSITTDELQRFFTTMPPSRSRDLCAVYVGQLFKKAFVTGVIKKNPYEQVEIKKHAPQKRSALTVEEQAAFLAAAKSSVHFLLYRFLLSTGLRIGEALAIMQEDLKDGKVNVSKDIVFIDGKEIVQPPKSKAAFRSVPVPGDIYTEMQNTKTERIFTQSYNAVRLAFKSLGLPYLRIFCATHTPRAWKKRAFRQRFSSIYLGIPKLTSRRTFTQTRKVPISIVFRTKSAPFLTPNNA